MKKEDILFALYKDKSHSSKEDFLKDLKQYKNEVDLRNLYIRIVNYQIDKYGCTLDSKRDTTNYVENMYIMGKWNKQDKFREYRKGNRT